MVQPLMDMPIEDLNISRDCIRKLKGALFTYVWEIVEFLENNVATGAMPEIRWGGDCFSEVTDELKVMGLWKEPDDF